MVSTHGTIEVLFEFLAWVMFFVFTAISANLSTSNSRKILLMV